MKKKGFIATSLIYSFFLVFLILMTTILVRSANNRILLSAVKEDIREDINGQPGFIIDTLPIGNYAVGSVVTYANEDWLVLRDATDAVLVVLNRALKQEELVNALGRSRLTLEYFGNCDVTSCQIRACRESAVGQEFCHIYTNSQDPSRPINLELRRTPSWNPSKDQVENGVFGKTIVSEAVNNWFNSHQGLHRAMEKDNLKLMTFSDGYMNHSGYVRIPILSEVSSINGVSPYHVLDSPSATPTNVNISTGSVVSSSAAFVRPVIEIKKGT